MYFLMSPELYVISVILKHKKYVDLKTTESLYLSFFSMFTFYLGAREYRSRDFLASAKFCGGLDSTPTLVFFMCFFCFFFVCLLLPTRIVL